MIRGRGAFARMLTAAYGPGRSPRTEPWYPYVFTSIDDPRGNRAGTRFPAPEENSLGVGLDGFREPGKKYKAKLFEEAAD